MKLLVTGGAGFIGSALVRHIVNCTGDSVINVDKITYAGNLESVASVAGSARYTFVQTDICNRSALDHLLATRQPDAIMHLAAETHVDRSITNAANFVQTNIIGTYSVLEAARCYWQKLPHTRQQDFRLHHVSTDEVYGDLGTQQQRFTEQASYAPSSPYSATKAGADHLVRAWHRTYGLPVIISNCSNNYGPYQFPEKLVPRMILRALAGSSLPIYGTGAQVRDWLYVDDHARALHKIITQGRIGETYNVGGDNEKRNIDVIHAICNLLDELQPSPIHARHDSLITHVANRPGHDQRYAIDSRKIRTELGWAPMETFASGMRKTVKWYLKSRTWLRELSPESMK